MSFIKIIKKILPGRIFYMLKKNQQKPIWKEYEDLSTKEVFTKIYSEHVWGTDKTNPGSYFSGGGSHDASQIEPYITAVKKFISMLDKKPDVTDLGCGDFNIGLQIRDVCSKYIACDIVDSLIEQNKVQYKDAGVHFRVFDLTTEKCESTDIVFLRQVLQHLSNSDIKKGLENIIPYCKYLVLTEHCPAIKNFKKNLDKPTGPDIRALIGSGLDITAAPFNYSLQGEIICEVPDAVGSIRTMLYKCN